MLLTADDFLAHFRLQNISYEEFCERLSVLDISDKSGQFAVRSGIDDFVKKVSKKDDRKSRLDHYKRVMYRLLVTDAQSVLLWWYDKYLSIRNPISHYFSVPASLPSSGIYDGRHKSAYGRICKNINFSEFYSTKKLYENDSEYCLGLMKAAFEDFKIRNSMVCPAFFDHVCSTTDNYDQFWADFMMGANKPTVFNPVVYRSIVDTLLSGDVLFAPVMGWNAYQLAFYETRFSKFVSTDVIPSVIENGNRLHTLYAENEKFSLVQSNKSIDLYLCPSEDLKNTNFLHKYEGCVDGILFSPPYFDLELYQGEDQSAVRYKNYSEWLTRYWEETILLCTQSMKAGARMAYVISNYTNAAKEVVHISEDTSAVASRHLRLIDRKKLKWSAIGGSRQAKKTRNGNYEDIWVYEKA